MLQGVDNSFMPRTTKNKQNKGKKLFIILRQKCPPFICRCKIYPVKLHLHLCNENGRLWQISLYCTGYCIFTKASHTTLRKKGFSSLPCPRWSEVFQQWCVCMDEWCLYVWLRSRECIVTVFTGVMEVINPHVCHSDLWPQRCSVGPYWLRQSEDHFTAGCQS